MKHLPIVSTFLALAIGAPASASAQHFWLDVNGDGQCTSEDVLGPSVTAVDVWVDTDTNQDGSPAVCSTEGEALSINSYSIILSAPAGGVTFMVWTDFMSYSATSFGFVGNDCWVTRVTQAGASPPGTYKLAQLVVMVTGNPVLQIVPSTSHDATAVTGFGSECAGANGDYVIRLQTDFTGACATSSPTPVSQTTWGQIKSMYR